MEFENNNICKKCGGMCCKKSGCDYFVSDFEKISYEVLNNVLETGNVSIVAVMNLYKLKGGKKVVTPFLYLRARNKDRDIVDLFSFKKQCTMLGETGCKYSLENRPGGGVNLIPKENGECYPNKNTFEEIMKWEPYQKVLSKLVKKYSGLSVDDKLKEDVENVIYQVLCDDFDGISEIEVVDMLSCISEIAECFPDQCIRAKEKRNKNIKTLIIKNN